MWIARPRADVELAFGTKSQNDFKDLMSKDLYQLRDRDAESTSHKERAFSLEESERPEKTIFAKLYNCK